MINTGDPISPERLAAIYQDTFRTFDPTRANTVVEVVYYPYIGMNHTIRVRNGKVFVRISDLCTNMTEATHTALAHILVAKLLRRRIPVWARDSYAAYTRTEEMREASTQNKQARGRKVVTTDKGEVYDLAAIFDKLNFDYFGWSIPKPVLTWSARKTYRILGHHDATHQTIVVSRSLDSKDVPKYVVEYIVFHEMLHIHHPTVHHNGRSYNHTPAFRRDEEQFEHFHAAERWIEQNVRKLKRRAKKK